MPVLHIPTPFGTMALEGDTALTRLYLPNQELPSQSLQSCPVLKLGASQLLEFFNGTRRNFDVPLAPVGTQFQQAVWTSLQGIPYGDTTTYGYVATSIGRPKGARAVGNANNRNPLPIFIPCHRVVGSGGQLIGYAGGLPLKQQLLTLEGHFFPQVSL